MQTDHSIIILSQTNKKIKRYFKVCIKSHFLQKIVMGDFMYNFYSYKKKKPIGLIITVIICTALIITTGYFIYKNITTPLPFERNEEVEITGDAVANITKENETVYNRHAVLNLTEKYKCGHNIVTSAKIPDSFTGKSIEDIKKENPELNITSYNDFSINAEQLIENECNNHYVIKLKNGKITSYNKSIPDITVKEITINLQEYLKEDIEILKNGIEVGSKEEMLEFFEDFA